MQFAQTDTDRSGAGFDCYELCGYAKHYEYSMSILLGFVVSAVAAVLPVSQGGDIAQIAQFNVNKQVIFANGIAKNQPKYELRRSAEEIAQNPVETMQDIARARILARWQARQVGKWNALNTKPFTANVSAYTAAYDETDSGDGLTASGVYVKERTTIACPPEYPFGAKVKFENLGTFICEDRGGAIKGNKFDMYVQTKSEAFAFGRQNIVAQVVL